MKFKFTYDKVDRSLALEESVELKISPIEKFLKLREGLSASVRFVELGKKIFKTELTIVTKVAVFKAEAKHNDIYQTIDIIKDKLTSQLKRMKSRLNNKMERVSYASTFELDAIDNEEEHVIVKRKKFNVQKESLEAATANIELLGHMFYIFRDATSNKVCVLYRRIDEDFGLIEVDDQ